MTSIPQGKIATFLHTLTAKADLQVPHEIIYEPMLEYPYQCEIFRYRILYIDESKIRSKNIHYDIDSAKKIKFWKKKKKMIIGDFERLPEQKHQKEGFENYEAGDVESGT